MGLHHIILLIVAASCASAVEVTTSNVQSEPEGIVDLYTKRFLRTDNTTEENYEARGVSTSIFESLKSVITPASIPQATLDRWVNNGKPVDKVFDQLQLNKAGVNLLEHSQFPTWVKYIQAFNEKYPEKTMGVVARLRERYDDVQLATLLNVAKKNSRTTLEASYFEKKWLQSLATHITPDDFFKALKLDSAGDKLLENPLFTTLTNFIRISNNKRPGQETILLKTLTNFYGDIGVIKMIETATVIPSTVDIAKRLQNEQIQLWVSKGYGPRYLFSHLGLDKPGKNIFDIPRFDT